MWSCKTVRSKIPLSVRMDEERDLCYFTLFRSSFFVTHRRSVVSGNRCNQPLVGFLLRFVEGNGKFFLQHTLHGLIKIAVHGVRLPPTASLCGLLLVQFFEQLQVFA